MGFSDHPGRWPSLAAIDAACRRIHDELRAVDYAGQAVRLLGLHASRDAPRAIVNPHRHSHYELIWILDGRGRARTAPGGDLRAGTVVLHPPNVLHAWENGPSPMLRIGLAFTLDHPAPARPIAAWPARPGLPEDLRALLAEAGSTRPGRRERLRARLVLLLSEALDLLELPAEPRRARRSADARLGAAIDRFLADNLDRPLALADVAVQARMSVPTLTRRYRRERGCSVMAQLQRLRLRLREAERLLAGRELAVKEVAARVGFADCSYFCRCFRRARGRTPTG